jgi:hypothetical protein
LGAVHQPALVRFGQHVGGLVRRRAVDAERHAHARRASAGTGATPLPSRPVALRAVGDAGAGVGEQPHLGRREVDEVGEPDVRPEPLLLGRVFERQHAERARQCSM